MCGTCGCGEHHHHHDHTHEHSHGHEHHHHPDEGIVINLEQDILQRNNLLAERNRGYFEAKNLFCLNLMSSSRLWGNLVPVRQPCWKRRSAV